ncbi:MAG TPA: MBL fold metallo-hydrolase [Candidatus Saccharimonadales bacterium]|nr:MBL fold metallo-hydrolase [Candidatus Saccharimonadales bacterium]
MELQYFGANCIKITTKKASIVIDDNLSQLGLKAVTKSTDISLRTSSIIPAPKESRFSAELPGEYEISGVIIHGVAARSHMDEEGRRTAVIYTIEADDVRLAVIGHVYPDLNEDQLEQIGMVDAAVIPIGGNGYTLDGIGALQIVKKIEPKIVIPSHYADKQIKYEVPQQSLDEGLKGLAMEPTEKAAKYKIKPAELTDNTKLVILERQ